MTTAYVLVKFAHVLVALVALGASAGLGIVLEFYGDHPTHGSFVLGNRQEEACQALRNRPAPGKKVMACWIPERQRDS